MAAITNLLARQTWTAVLVLFVLAGILLALGAGTFTEERVQYVGTLGALALGIAGMIIMWHSERTPPR